MKQKYAKNKIFKNCEIDYNSFTNFEYETHAITVITQVSEFSETCWNLLGKIREITSNEHIFGGFSCLEPLAVTHLRQGSNKSMYVGHFCSLHHFVHGDLSFIVTIHNVLRDGTIKKYGLLRDYSQLTSDVINVETFYIEAVQSLWKD